jgi:putative hydrolase of the HAD superfamily
MNSPHVVVFDLGKVLLDFDYGRAAKHLAEESSVTALQVQEFIDHSSLLIRYEKGQLSRQEFFEEVRALTGYRGSLETFSEFFANVFTPIEPMVQLQERLQAAEIPTYIFSNTNDIAIEHIRETYPFYHRFDGHILSYERGFMKPEQELYEMMEEMCGQRGSSILYLDDREENIQAGLDRGWTALVHAEPDTSVRWVTDRCLGGG